MYPELVSDFDVMSETKIAVLRYAPVEGGLRIDEVICVDPKGFLPQFVKDLIARNNSDSLRRMV